MSVNEELLKSVLVDIVNNALVGGQIQDILWGARLLAGASTEIERLRASLIDLHAEADQRAARIQELEDALKVEKAWVRQYQKWLVEEVAEGMSENGFADDDLRQKARDSLILDGKIEPDADAKPHCWQITDERKAALLRAYDIVSWIDRADSDNKLHITAILGMIKEAEAGRNEPHPAHMQAGGGQAMKPMPGNPHTWPLCKWQKYQKSGRHEDMLAWLKQRAYCLQEAGK